MSNMIYTKKIVVAGSNWTVDNKEDIYSGVISIDNFRIGFVLGELYGWLNMHSYMESINRKNGDEREIYQKTR
jgi:hypothetical protein